MKYFLTGSTGFLGQHLFERISGSISLHDRTRSLDKIDSFNPDVIYHCAAEIYDESQMFESNIKLTYDLLEKAKNLPNLKAFIYIGSSSEYGRKDHPMSESDLLDPTNLYEATKGAGSLLCQAYARRFGVPTMIARPFSLYGKHEPKHRLIPTVIKNVRSGWENKIAPGVHDFIHIDDFIDGLFMLENDPKPGECFNFGTGKQISNLEVLKEIESQVGRRARYIEVDPMHEYDNQCWVAAPSKLKGWKPKYSFSEGIKEVLRHI